MTIENMFLFFLIGTAAGWLASRTVTRANFEIVRDAISGTLNAGQRGWSSRPALDRSQERSLCSYESPVQHPVLSIAHEQVPEEMALAGSQAERLSHHD